MMHFEFTPLLSQIAIKYAFKAATPEGKMTIYALAVVSMLSWTVIVTKARQLWRARKRGKKFFEAYRSTRDPLDLYRKKQEFDGVPAYELYFVGAEELTYQLKNKPVEFNGKTMIPRSSFDFVRVAMERTVSAEGMGLEKGMIVLSTAVAGGPFIGLLGTVWGVMETFSGVAIAKAATLTAMAPGVAGALIATVVGLLVAIPAMFAYNFMVTQVRGITQELDDFGTEFATQLEHAYVDPRAENHEVLPFGGPERSDEDLKSSPHTDHMAHASLTGS